jgi:alkylated DNA repair dioxygenase AlkB
VASVHESRDLFGRKPSLPEGFRYAADIIDAAEEQVLLQDVRSLPFKEFEFHGFTGKRRVVSFGWRYDFNGGGLQKTDDMPPFLLRVREKAAAFARIAPSDLQQVLVTEYRPGAAIGWHKDRSVFGDVIGLSFLSPCVFRFRRKASRKWDDCRPTFHISAAWSIAQRVGAQHPGGKGAAVLAHLQESAGAGAYLALSAPHSGNGFLRRRAPRGGLCLHAFPCDAAGGDEIDGPHHPRRVEVVDHVPGAFQHIKPAARDRAIPLARSSHFSSIAMAPIEWRSSNCHHMRCFCHGQVCGPTAHAIVGPKPTRCSSKRAA